MPLSELWFDPTLYLINGTWHSAAQTLTLHDPSDGTALAQIARCGAPEIDAAVTAARNSRYQDLTALERGRLLTRLGQLVTKRIETLAQLEARDVGKPLTQARADALALARYCEFYGGAADKITGETIPFQTGYTALTLREPHGVTGHIVPWNYPMQIIGRSVGAALAMGNRVVLKPAEEACLTALAFAHLAQEAGFPDGAINLVPGLGEEAGAALAAHPEVDHLSFTGSGPVGAKVQIAAAQHTAPVTLELGGKSPQILFADADLERALPFLVGAGVQNAGQTCSAASRILIERPIFETVRAQMAARYEAMIAAPARADQTLGPLISARQKALVESYLDAADGLELVARGQIAPDTPEGGYYVAPHLFAGTDPMHKLAQEEIFGPVQILLPFEGEQEAREIANGTPYGLVAGVWTADGARAMRMAHALRAGQVFINNYGAGGGVELPFGGVGASGHGREKGFEALYGFSQLKTVAMWHG